MKDDHYIVAAQGDCIETIAFSKGVTCDKIWNHPKNEALRNKRKNLNVLSPKDRIFIPGIELKDIEAQSDSKHVFKRKGVPSKLRLRFLFRGEPRKNDPYTISLDGNGVKRGTLDDDGCLEITLSPSVKRAQIVVGEGRNVECRDLYLGGIDPITEVSGLQQRLINLGYPCRLETQIGESTTMAIRLFQKANGLSVTGKPDEETMNLLENKYGS